MPSKPKVYTPPHIKVGTYEADRQANVLWRRWYKLQAWINLRTAQLRQAPLCAECARAKPPRVTAANTVHHIRPHRGDYALFHDASNLESVCAPCHNSVIQSRERQGQ